MFLYRNSGIILCLLILATVVYLAGCQKQANEVSTAEFLKEHVEWLADDTRKGRLAGTMQEAEAANYISDRFSFYGLLPMVNMETYVQQFELTGPITQLMEVENHISRNIVGGCARKGTS